MANELRIKMTPVATFTGLTTIVAQIVGLDGVQVGANIVLTEDAGSNARYRGDVPGGTGAGEYDVVFIDTTNTDVILGTTALFWDGTAEVDELTFRDSPPTAAAIASQVRTELTTELGRIDVATSTRSSHAAPDLSNLDATVSSRLATAGYTAPLSAAQVNAECDTAISDAALATAASISALNDPTAATIADAVWDEARAGHVAAGSFGATSEWSGTGGLDAAGVRAAVGLASANLDTQLGSLATAASISALNDISTADVNAQCDTAIADAALATAASISALNDPTAAAVASQVRTELTTELARIDVAISTRSSHAAPDLSNLDVAVSTRSSHAAPDLSNLDATVSSRLATSGYTAPLSAAQVNAECDTAIADASLATAASVAALNDPTAATIADAVWDETRASHVTAGSFGAVSEWSGAGGGGLDAAGVRAAVGLATANLDTQLAGIVSENDTTQLAIAALNDLSAADVNAECDTAIADAALATAASVAALNDPTAASIADAVWDEARAGHTVTGTYGATSEWTGSISGTVDANVVQVSGSGVSGVADFHASGFAVAGDAMTLTSAERTAVANEVDVVLTASHGNGQWTSDEAPTRPRLGVSYDDISNTLELNVHAERDNVRVTPLTMTLVWRNPDGTTLFSITEASSGVTLESDDAYRYSLVQALTVGSVYRVEVTVTDATGTIGPRVTTVARM